MGFSQQIAKNFRQLHFGPSLVGASLKDTLEGVSWEEATTKVGNLNTIAKLVFHINYYVSAVIEVLEGKPLNAHDKYSYDMKPIESEADWQELLQKVWDQAETFASLAEMLSDEDLASPMGDGKYGNWFKNLLIIQEHSNYHLGQIVLMKKMVRRSAG